MVKKNMKKITTFAILAALFIVNSSQVLAKGTGNPEIKSVATTKPIPEKKTTTFYNPRNVTTFPAGTSVIVCGNYLLPVCATIKGVSDASNIITVTTFNEDGSVDNIYNAVNVTLDVNEENNEATITIIPD